MNYEVKAPIEVVEEKKTVNTEFTIEEFEVLFKDVKPIYFEIGKYGIRFDASKELDKIVKIMNENPTLEIELGSHTDCLSNDELNLVLSHNRAKSTAEYIKQLISHPERINGKGYGESRPKIDCDCSQEVASKKKCSESDNQLNRRTEFIMKSEKSELIEDISLLPYRTYMNKINKDTSLEKNNSNINSSELVDEKNKSLNTSKFRTDITLSEEQKLNISKGFYILQEGETLYRASINTQVPIQQIRKLNNLKSNNVYPGTKLLLK